MTNRVRVRPNGPLKCLGNIRVEDIDGNLLEEGDDIALCRCGESQHKPFCDGRHKDCGFLDEARFKDEKREAPAGETPLVIVCRPNAMLIAKGPMEILGADDELLSTRNKAAFCRCGHSSNKPFCDASHKDCGFVSD